MRHYVFTANGRIYDIEAYDYREALQQLCDRVLTFDQRSTSLSAIHASKIFDFKLERTYSE